MRNLFLLLLLANLLVGAWQLWVQPAPAPVAAAGDVPELKLFGGSRPAVPSPVAGSPSPPDLAGGGNGGAATPATGRCLRIGPFPDGATAAELASSLADRRLPVTTLALEGQVWIGNWVQVAGFRDAAEAESARQRLVSGGLTDALLIQDGSVPVISLGVFRERERADRVMAAARQLGFSPLRTDRYRPGTQHWVLTRESRDRPIVAGSFQVPGAQILRAEPYGCDALEGGIPPAVDAAGAAAAPSGN
jgi:hypothetical protein